MMLPQIVCIYAGAAGTSPTFQHTATCACSQNVHAHTHTHKIYRQFCSYDVFSHPTMTTYINMSLNFMFLKLINIPRKKCVNEFSSPILWHNCSYKFLYRFLKFAL